MSTGKDVIYIDIEDDITAIIGKLKSSSKKIVALVPPKRASVFNSFVNLKLLKKASTDAEKRLVLVTADESLTALAGNLGLYVAKNLQTPPTIPESDPRPNLPSAVIQASGVKVADAAVEEATEDVKQQTAKKDKKPKKLKPLASDKKLPDFNRFRKWLFIGGGGIAALLLLWWWAFFVAPTADVVLSADQTRIRTEFNLVVGLGDNEQDDDSENQFIAGQRKTIELNQTAQAEATGEKNVGEKASGDMTIYNETGTTRSLVAGTRFQTSGDRVFLLNEDTSVGPATLDDEGNVIPGTVTATVTANEPGGDYNIPATDYTIPGLSSSLQSKIYGEGEAMGGGTDEIVSVLTKEDVDRAVAGLVEDDTSRDEILGQLAEEFSGEVYLFEDTLEDSTKDPQATPKVGSETDSAQVVATQTYSIVGVSRTELESIIVGQYESELKPQQTVTNTGLDELVPTITDESDSRVTFNIISNGLAGPDLDLARLKDELTGRRYSDALGYIEQLPSVNEVNITLSPIWVGSMPRTVNKIDIEIESPGLTNAPDDTTTENNE
jgi:hypothetical protein